MKTIHCLTAAFSVAAGVTLSAWAGSTTYVLPDVGNFSDYLDSNLSDTFSGTGFVGIYPYLPNDVGPAGPAFAHLWGLENYNGIFSETELQVDISGLAGKTVTGATLSYVLRDGGGGSQSVKITSYTSTGLLGFNTAPPNDLGSVVFTSNGLAGNSADVTALVENAVMAGQNWLGLFLAPEGPGQNFQYSYTTGFGGDEALARLDVTFTPEPPAQMATGALLLVGAMGCVIRRRMAK
jgi:hypothetical protein